MPVDQKRIIALALANLEGEKSRIDAEIAELRAQLGGKSAASNTKAKAAKNSKPTSTLVRTAAQKAQTSSAMKKLWAKVRKAGFTNIKDYQASLSKV